MADSVHRDQQQEHAARLIIVDGLELLPGLAGLSKERLAVVRENCLSRVRELAQPFLDTPTLSVDHGSFDIFSSTTHFGIGPFKVAKGPTPSNTDSLPFAMQAPTTLDNLLRVLRACQLPKSILLEGSPGVGKTTLVQALADASGRALCRVNLSEQTDLIDLFGSDLPVVGGQAGEFAWQDAAFLNAMKNGDWVLLDEMNLASQAILEGLNAVLDHRGSVFIPELGKTFDKHPDFRIFAAQNPVQQGGGRKGLPKSFLNRFTKVYVQEHQRSDLLVICRHLYPTVSVDIIERVVDFNGRLQAAVMRDRLFGYDGSPWEFNLRDIIRCFRLMLAPTGLERVSALEDALKTIYIRRFRNKADQVAVSHMLQEILQMDIATEDVPWPSLTTDLFRVGHSTARRRSSARWSTHQLQVAPSALQAQEAMLRSVAAGWLTILVGSSGSGKRSLVRNTAEIVGAQLSEYSMHPAVDTMEMLGSFEQTDRYRHVASLLQSLLTSLHAAGIMDVPSGFELEKHIVYLEKFIDAPGIVQMTQIVASFDALLDAFATELGEDQVRFLKDQMESLSSSTTTSSFEWIDGPLVAAIKNGGWYLINDANLCSSSVLDRLNSLCELNGTLILSERGNSEEGVEVIKPHPDFRLFMAFDPRNGELSRAMRNRGVEIGLFNGTLPAERGSTEGISIGLQAAYGRLSHVDLASVTQILGLLQDGLESHDLIPTTLGRLVTSQAPACLGDVLPILRVLFSAAGLVQAGILEELRQSLHGLVEGYNIQYASSASTHPDILAKLVREDYFLPVRIAFLLGANSIMFFLIAIGLVYRQTTLPPRA
jgi:midasin